jgi:hypothetical protein
MTDEEILAEVDRIVDGLAHDIREYARIAVKHLSKTKAPPPGSRCSFIEYYGAKEMSGPIVGAAIAEVTDSYTEADRNTWLVNKIRRIVEAEESKS